MKPFQLQLPPFALQFLATPWTLSGCTGSVALLGWLSATWGRQRGGGGEGYTVRSACNCTCRVCAVCVCVRVCVGSLQFPFYPLLCLLARVCVCEWMCVPACVCVYFIQFSFQLVCNCSFVRWLAFLNSCDGIFPSLSLLPLFPPSPSLSLNVQSNFGYIKKSDKAQRTVH